MSPVGVGTAHGLQVPHPLGLDLALQDDGVHVVLLQDDGVEDLEGHPEVEVVIKRAVNDGHDETIQWAGLSISPGEGFVASLLALDVVLGPGLVEAGGVGLVGGGVGGLQELESSDELCSKLACDTSVSEEHRSRSFICSIV